MTAGFGTGHTNNLPQSGYFWDMDIEGACAELAVAKHTNLVWGAVNKGNVSADVGSHYGVRYTRYKQGRLIIHDSDPDEFLFWLVTGGSGTYDICGYILGKDAKKDKWLDDPTGRNRPAYFVPQYALFAPNPI